MPPSPSIAPSKLKIVCLFLIRIVGIIFRSVTSVMVLIAALILGAILGYFCFLGGSSAVGMCLKGALATHLLDVRGAVSASQDIRKLGGVSSLFSVGFLAWKRWPEFTTAFRAVWRWIWIGGIEETRGLVSALTKQLVVYAGLFFSAFVIGSIAKDGQVDPVVTVPSDLTPFRTVVTQVFDTKIQSLQSVLSVETNNFRKQLTELKATMEDRGGLLVYFDKAQGGKNNPQDRFDLIYVALFDNASFTQDSNQGRTLSSGERKRLVNFANSLRNIAKACEGKNAEPARLRIEVRGFASDAPKTAEFPDKDKFNKEIANDRARLVHAILKEALKDVAVDLVAAKIWTAPAEMQANRQFDDRSIRYPQPVATALAEAPNRRVEILITLPEGLRFRVSDIGELPVTQR